MSEKRRVTRRDVLRVMGVGAGTALVPAAIADLSSNHVVVERTELTLPRWDADGFRVAIVSDLHANRPDSAERAEKAFRMAMAEKPDAILIPGDFVDLSRDDVLELLAETLKPLGEAGCPVIATMGNHDYWSKEPHKIIETIRNSPVKLLRNEAVEVNGVTIAGIDDAIANRHNPEFIEKGKHSKSLLTLFHEPDFVDEVPEHISLQVSGHSHGGQICLPGGVPLHTPAGARKYSTGYYPDARVPLFVTRGVGTTGINWRLFCLPEVSVLTLRGT